MKKIVLIACLAIAQRAAAQDARPLKVDDIFALKNVGDPRVSPDGKWVAYTVSWMREKEDDSDTDIYTVPFAGGDSLRMTTSSKSESSPRWSPDGRYLAFLSGRDGNTTQVWLLDRQGGEAAKLTDFKTSVGSFVWSPDSARLAIIMSDPDPDKPADSATDALKTAKPIVIQRLQFKQDGQGYLRNLRRHIHVFDVQKKTSMQVTNGPYDDSAPAWSPDSKRIAFVSNRTSEPDSNQNTDIFVVDAAGNQPARQLTTSPESDSAPAFSPDGTLIAYVAGGDPKDIWYAVSHLSVTPAAGGISKSLTASLDRNVSSPRFTPDGRWIVFTVEDGGNVHLARTSPSGGVVERIVSGERTIQAFDIGQTGAVAIVESQPDRPGEVSTAANGVLKRLTSVNDAFLKGIRLGKVERFKSRSADGTLIDGFLTVPPETPAGTKLPAILRIHGGPVAQYSTSFNSEWQILAAQGYAVISANPRGSSGYGHQFSRAIWADWGNKDFDDVLGAVDHVVNMGVADAERLGVGGWSYGGILTNYVITKSDRFKAAISGASEVNYLANYGTDHYQRQWEAELGLPWKNTDLWMKISPWYSVEKIVTPTLIMCGEDDMNVPLLNSEQLYQALRRLGKTTELVIYPEQTHSISRPSYQKDRYERYIAWYDRFLKPPATTSAAEPKGRAAEARSLLGVPLFSVETTGDARRRLDENMTKATEDFIRDPDNADSIIWLGRRQAYLGRFRDAIATFSRGIEKQPRDFRLYRHRGHRYITVREFDKAISDLEKASALIQGVPDQIEPDGAPNSRNIPVSTSHFNIWYHLGLAYYLKGDFENALRSFRECAKFSVDSNDRLVAASDWLYMILRRLHRNEEAAKVLEPIRKDMEIIENGVYHERLLMYKGEKKPEDLLKPDTTDIVQLATYGYGVANWYYYNGQPDRAREVFHRIVQGQGWAAFGFIAAEAELARGR